MATYLGADSSVGGSLYRRQPYTYIGQTKLQSPFKLNYDTQYSQQAQSTAPNIGTYSFPYSEDYTPTAGQQFNLESAFPNMQQQWIKGAGAEQYFPTNGTEGQIYEDNAGVRWQLQAGQWRELGRNVETGAWQYSDIDNLLADATKLVADKKTELALAQMKYALGPHGPGMENPRLTEAKQAYADAKAKLDELKKNKGPVNAEPNIIAPRQQMEDVLQSINTGELKLTNDEGVLDTTTLRGQGEFGNWMADMLENSYKTGALQSDFYQTDEQGNLIRDEQTGKPLYVPELQTMIDYITNGTPEDQQRWNQYRRDMAGYALAQGQTLNSGFYQEQLAQDVAMRASQASEQISSMMTKEIGMQYEYIQNSLANALTQMGYLTNEEQFIDAMRTNYAQIQESYREGIEELAQQVAEAEAARRGDIFGAIIGGIANIALGFFL